MRESRLKRIFDLVTAKYPRYARYAQTTACWLEDHALIGWLLEEIVLPMLGAFVFACILTTVLFWVGWL